MTQSLRAAVAANERWSRLDPDQRSAATAKARAAADARFEKIVDPDGRLTPQARAKLAANARRAHFQRMALASAKARARR